MAVVIVIMGLVMMTVLPALATIRSSNQMSLTQSNLRSLMLATASYVQANGCLPCPAVAGMTGANFGKLGTGAACGVCSAPEGIPPFVALGISASVARDGWGHWITMRVDPALTVLPNSPGSVFVPPWALCTAADASKGLCVKDTSSKGFCASGLSKTNSVRVTTPMGATQYAAVIFVSHGKNGYGAYIADPITSGTLAFPPQGYAACTTTGGFARCNSTHSSTQFYDAPAFTNDYDSYDGLLSYIDRNALVGMLGTGACSTAW